MVNRDTLWSLLTISLQIEAPSALLLYVSELSFKVIATEGNVGRKTFLGASLSSLAAVLI